jgi:dipeptidase E
MLKNFKLIAIGGGEIGRPGYPTETTLIDKEIIRLSGKKRPRFLFIPTASNDAKLYAETAKKHFGKRLGCIVDVLYLLKEKPLLKIIAQKIAKADIIYVGGGNTLFMMNKWRRYGVDKLLIKAAQQGKVMAGLSAGSICWFKSGLSDSRQFKNEKANFIKVSGLNLINALHCPHYDFEPARKKSLKIIMKKASGVAIALDNCCALEIIGNSYRVIKSQTKAGAYKIYWRKGKFFHESIPQAKNLLPLSSLIKIPR